MITLPTTPAPNGATPELIDFGIVLQSPTGASTERYNRKGSRFRIAVSYPPMLPDVSRVFISRLLTAKRDGLRMPLPLLLAQGSPGFPQVDGAGQSGTTLLTKNITSGYQFKEGFWLSIVDSTGRHYLHNVRSDATVAGTGKATILIEPALRVPFLNSTAIYLADPKIEGLVTSVISWDIPLTKFVAVQFTLEESH